MPTPAVVPPTLLVLLVEQDGMPMLATIYQRLSESKELPWRALLLGVIVVGGLMIGIGGKTDDGWHTIYWYGAVLILTAQMSHTTRSFFMGEGTAPWLRVPSWRRHRCCPARLGPGLLHAPRRSAPTPSVLALRVPTPPMLRLPGPSIWDFLRYFLALDNDLKTVEKVPTRPHSRHLLSPHTLAPHPRPTLSPHFSHHPALTPPNPAPLSPRPLTPRPARTGAKASKSDSAARKHVGFLTLMPSTFITWIFAKSINNSATLGGRFGLLGGVAYAGPSCSGHHEERACHAMSRHRGPSSSASS